MVDKLKQLISEESPLNFRMVYYKSLFELINHSRREVNPGALLIYARCSNEGREIQCAASALLIRDSILWYRD